MLLRLVAVVLHCFQALNLSIVWKLVTCHDGRGPCIANVMISMACRCLAPDTVNNIEKRILAFAWDLKFLCFPHNIAGQTRVKSPLHHSDMSRLIGKAFNMNYSENMRSAGRKWLRLYYTRQTTFLEVAYSRTWGHCETRLVECGHQLESTQRARSLKCTSTVTTAIWRIEGELCMANTSWLSTLAA